ncbi:iron-sulfur cluster assembly accessory protein [Fulvivirgaceae bacterium BMA10]|uniref:Iron-sulfur cluster assembly accessory protein n=1 Tax=Splendidivirga corallicola TaxID=3051826 RepID=A0ABT8KRS1_9BACT|nr:iron-sulfur cluster assembly accessory protein [Fulvivirgaceae bacterium BMA10]
MSDKMTPVTITDKAVKEIKEIIRHKNIPAEYGLRIGIKGGVGCAGVSFLLGFDKKKETDDEFEIDGITVYLEKKHFMYLIGMQVDFYEGADARGFSFVKQEDA